jgi:two-component system cell cycle sensor histidine kinase/response regulator CckA
VFSILSGLEARIAEAAGKSVAVEIAQANSPVWALADPEQLEQVILTLLSATREGDPQRTRITITCGAATISERPPKAALSPGVYASLVIHDNGRGLDAGKSAAIFEPVIGPRAPESEPPEQPSVGSLTRAYAIVREWGGDIAFFSGPSRGSTFLVYLPYAEAEPEHQPEIPVQAAPPAPPPVVEAAPEPTRETILVVEDEPGIRALVRKILRRERYHVLEAGSAEEALGLAEAEGGRIDLLLTDVMLPGLSGRALAERMRESIPELDVLYISGFTDDDAVRVGAFPPGAKFLQKPFTLGALVGTVRAALDA